MSAGWVAGSVRARALARRRIGASAASDLARCDSLPTALARLGPTPYGRSIRAGQDLGEAQHAVAAALLWHLRVLAGWLPPDGAELIRVLCGGFEIANVDELLQRLAAKPAGPNFHLGSLATAWSHLADASSTQGLRAKIAVSPWGDPGGDDPQAIQAGMRLAAP
jgi:vacuolar-type H+-ATPase subunit C/Vma6